MEISYYIINSVHVYTKINAASYVNNLLRIYSFLLMKLPLLVDWHILALLLLFNHCLNTERLISAFIRKIRFLQPKCKDSDVIHQYADCVIIFSDFRYSVFCRTIKIVKCKTSISVSRSWTNWAVIQTFLCNLK